MLDVLSEVIDATAVNADVDAFRLHGVVPGAVVEPGSSAEAAAVLRLASERGWRVELAGAGTQAYGNRRTRADVVLSSRRMNGVVEYEPADLVVGAQAGMPIEQLTARTRAHGQHLALDPPADERSTLGGMLATARSGPLRFSQGTPRDHALGLEVVTGDGRVLRVGGRVVKNVAGYDLVRLLVGSGGTLAFICSAYLRLKPVPQADVTLQLTAGAPDPLIDAARSAVADMLEVAALELLAPGVLGSEWTLLVRLAGNPEAVGDASARLAGYGPAAADASPDAWRTCAQAELEATTIVRLADLPTRLPLTMQIAHKLIARAGSAGKIIAHAGDGIVRVHFTGSAAEATAFAIGEARATLAVSGGTVVAHSRDADLIRRADAFGAVGAARSLMNKLKQVFDPAGILAPGRFLT